jgi:carbamoyltransferase
MGVIRMSGELCFAVHVGHNASAALMRDGVIVAAALEERFCRTKNVVGYPKHAIEFCLRTAGVAGSDLGRIATTTVNRSGLMIKAPTSTAFTLRDYHDYYGDRYYGPMMRGADTFEYLRWLRDDPKFNAAEQHFDFSYLTDAVLKNPAQEIALFHEQTAQCLASHLGVDARRIEFLDHHTCHAYYAYFGSPFRGGDTVALTMDSWGDGRNQTVWKFSDERATLLAESAENDLARIYKMATLVLAMRPDEHEFKVMGLAPYAKPSHVARARAALEDLLTVDGMRVVHKNRPRDLYAYLRSAWLDHRFDNIGGAVQSFTERIAAELVENIVAETGVRRLVLSGGVAMNVKMNKVIAELECVDALYVCGSGGDESLSIGGCYVMNAEAGTNASLPHMYLGFDIADEMPTFNASAYADRFDVTLTADADHVAALLVKGEIVAVARGRAEFGARALGNRSILANPSRRESVQQINEAIKNRDFWMPFALSILDERHAEYLVNPKQLASPVMSISLDARMERYHDIEAGTHPYDRTVRPQFVSQEHAPAYHRLIAAFDRQTGIPALLNTSFNLHGEPIVDTIADAVRTFEVSGLDHLWINDSVLMSKRT